MSDIEKVIKGLENCLHYKGHCRDCPYNSPNCQNDVLKDAIAILKGQEAVELKNIPEELKQKMWNALYAEEDEYEKKFVGKEEHLNWFTVYRPWLQKGFGIAINAIADWEGQ